jgi:hypothetical protein
MQKRYNFLFREDFPAENKYVHYFSVHIQMHWLEDVFVRQNLFPPHFLVYAKTLKMIKKFKDPNAIEEMKSRVTWIDFYNRMAIR